jgi:predicted RNA-binding protein YlxR (DUF448 family)
MKNKRELLRVVRTQEGDFLLDATGKKSGRGAYICPTGACFERAFKQKGLERSFRQPVPPEIYGQLRAQLEAGGVLP